jgi:hypothetical protein
MGVPTSEVGYISATAGRGDHEVHLGHVVALGDKKIVTFMQGIYNYTPKPSRVSSYVVLQLFCIYSLCYMYE